jgi:hypothetical protein
MGIGALKGRQDVPRTELRRQAPLLPSWRHCRGAFIS